MIKSYSRGHLIIFEDNEWRYLDSRVPIIGNERPCKHCGKMPTKDGYDACLGYLEGVKSACCGHGMQKMAILLKSNMT